MPKANKEELKRRARLRYETNKASILEYMKDYKLAKEIYLKAKKEGKI